MAWPAYGDRIEDIDQGLNWAYCEPDGPPHDLPLPAPPLALDPSKPQIEADQMQFDQTQRITEPIGAPNARPC